MMRLIRTLVIQKVEWMNVKNSLSGTVSRPFTEYDFYFCIGLVFFSHLAILSIKDTLRLMSMFGCGVPTPKWRHCVSKISRSE